MGGPQAARVLSTVRGGFATDEERDAFEAPILETYEREGSPVLRDGAAVGRRGHRPARYAAHPGDGHRGGAPRADPRDPLRRLPDVRGWLAVSTLMAWLVAGCSVVADAALGVAAMRSRSTARNGVSR